MFEWLQKLWDDNGFEILLIISVVIIIILAIFRIGKKGTWSKSYWYKNDNYTPFSPFSPKSNVKIKKDSSGETECRRVLEHIFNKSFEKSRPNFLSNPVTGGNFNLELDCYCPELGLACEYNGEQHYKYIAYFHRNRDAFINQKYRDELKRRMCRDNNIRLIEVPYTVKINNIQAYIINSLRKIGYLL